MVVARSLVWLKDGIEVQSNSLKHKFDLRSAQPQAVESETGQMKED